MRVTDGPADEASECAAPASLSKSRDYPAPHVPDPSRGAPPAYAARGQDTRARPGSPDPSTSTGVVGLAKTTMTSHVPPVLSHAGPPTTVNPHSVSKRLIVSNEK